MILAIKLSQVSGASALIAPVGLIFTFGFAHCLIMFPKTMTCVPPASPAALLSSTIRSMSFSTSMNLVLSSSIPSSAEMGKENQQTPLNQVLLLKVKVLCTMPPVTSVIHESKVFAMWVGFVYSAIRYLIVLDRNACVVLTSTPAPHASGIFLSMHSFDSIC